MIKIENWVHKSVGPSGEIGSERMDRLCNESILFIDENIALLLPQQFNYMIFYFDTNDKLLRKRGFRGDRINTIILMKNECVRIYAASSSENIDILLFKNLNIIKCNPYFIDNIFVNPDLKKIKLIGDSITAGSGGSGYSNSGNIIISNGGLSRYENLYGICWGNYFKYRMQSEKNLIVDNWGCSKYTSVNLLTVLKDLIKEDDEVIFCMIGTNDRLIKDDTLENYRDRILSIIAFCLLQDKKLILMSCIPSSIEKEQIEINYTLKDQSAILKEVCNDLEIPFIDMYQKFLEELNLNRVSLDECLNDGLHPNDQGYYLMYRVICKALNINAESKNATEIIDINNDENENCGQKLYHANFGDCLYYSTANENNIRIYYYDQNNNFISEEILPANTFEKIFTRDVNFKLSVDTETQNFPFIPYYEKRLIPLRPENIGERIYYERMCNEIFSEDNVKDNWNISKILMWNLVDESGNKINAKDFADKILNGIIILNTRQVLKVNNLMWEQTFQAVSRSSKLQQFSLFWITLLLDQYKITGNIEYLNESEKQIESFINWLHNDYSKLGLSFIPSAEHAYAVRCIVFTNALSVFPKNWRLRHEVLVLLIQHSEWLRNLNVKILNNHGLIMLEGLMHVVNILVDQDNYRNTLLKHIETRLAEIYEANFDSDGLAKENTIGYHIFNLKCIQELFMFAKSMNIKINSPQIEQNLNKCNLVTQQMIYQNGKIPPIGDGASLNSNIKSINKSCFYKEAGWLVIKDECKYISFKSGMISDAHKHIDDCSLLVRYAGRDIFVDSGMYNYDREDPIRKYVESAAGHSGLYPVSLYNILSPEYCRKIYCDAGIRYYLETKDSKYAQGYYILKNGFCAERTIQDYDGVLKINDSFRSNNLERVETRFCLHPKTKLLKKYKNFFLFKNNGLYFSIKISTSSQNFSINLQDGYYSEYANEFEQNKILVLSIMNENFSNVETVLKYGFNIEDVLDELLVDINIINNEVNVRCNGHKMSNYSYYLYNNNICQQKFENINNHSCKFFIKDDGEYYVCVGYKKNNCFNTKFVQSDSFYIKKRKISIFGSCVSRDIFEYDKLGQLELKTYVARQSVLSSVAKPINIDDTNINLNSQFQKRMVLTDLRKTAFDEFAHDESKYLLIDLIDDRFSIAEYKNSLCTFSNEFSNGMTDILCNINLKPKLLKRGKLFLDKAPVDDMIDEFCKRISKIYDPEHIILHKALMVDKYIALDGRIKDFSSNYLKNNKKLNTILNYMYLRIEQNLPGIHIIDEMYDTHACENHKWGLAPMHYEEKYYYRVLNKILKILK